jgi:hypothetical protein
MYMPDEVFHDWKSIRIKEEEKKSPEQRATVQKHKMILKCIFMIFIK